MPEGRVSGRWSSALVDACSLGKRWCVQIETQKIPFEHQGNTSLLCGWLLEFSRQIVESLHLGDLQMLFWCAPGHPAMAATARAGGLNQMAFRDPCQPRLFWESCEDACPAWLGPGVVLGYCVVVCEQVAWLTFGTGWSNLMSLIGCASIDFNSRFTLF